MTEGWPVAALCIMFSFLFIVLLFIFLLMILSSCIRVVPQARSLVVERMGAYLDTWNVGVHFAVPFIDRVARKVNLKEQVADFAPQPVITKDNVTMRIDTVVFFQITDPKLFAYGVENPLMALENLTATTLRNIVGDLELDETLTSRDSINMKMQAALDPATDKWGIRVNRVELKNIIPPRDIQDAMEKQMKAERQRRQTLLEAEAHREASIKRAEGDKAAMVLTAQAESEAAITRARGEAESIRLVYDAQAAGMQQLSNVNVSEGAMLMKRLEALQKLGDGQATKLVVPTELASSAAQLSYIGSVLNLPDGEKRPVQPMPAPQGDPCCDRPGASPVTREQASRPPQMAQQAAPAPQSRPAPQAARPAQPSRQEGSSLRFDRGPAQRPDGTITTGTHQRPRP